MTQSTDTDELFAMLDRAFQRFELWIAPAGAELPTDVTSPLPEVYEFAGLFGERPLMGLSGWVSTDGRCSGSLRVRSAHRDAITAAARPTGVAVLQGLDQAGVWTRCVCEQVNTYIDPTTLERWLIIYPDGVGATPHRFTATG